MNDLAAPTYRARLSAEQDIYRDDVDVHGLPDIFHYWSNRHVLPKLEAFGFSGPVEMFRKYLEEQCQARGSEAKRFVSIGSGNCDLEVGLASHLRAAGLANFVIDCVDLNPVMLERGRVAAANHDLAAHLHFVEADFNDWNPDYPYDAVIANQSLHHVVELEKLFGQIKSSLKPGGRFIVSDMIGRNGHQRWPEALEIVHQFWRQLPPSYRFNRKLQRYEELFEDWDCSVESFEGIRSQDILPLLVEYFQFQLFVGFGNVIDPFVDRAFGYNFDPAAAWDRNFIDRVHQRDQEEIDSGRLAPTHLLAVMGNDVDEPVPVRLWKAPPEVVAAPMPREAYAWHTWPHDAQSELEIACRRLSAAEERLKGLPALTQQFTRDIEEQTAWALRLDLEVEEKSALAVQLNRELEERTAWALRLNEELERLTWARGLDRRFHRPLAAGFQMVRRVRDWIRR